MFTHLFETYRKTSESWLQMQQDTIKTAVQQMTALTPDVTGAVTEWNKTYRERFVDAAIEILNRHHESLLALYDLTIAAVQQTSKVREAKTAEESRAVLEDLWRQWFNRIASQSENQMRDAQSWVLKSVEIVQKPSS